MAVCGQQAEICTVSSGMARRWTVVQVISTGALSMSCLVEDETGRAVRFVLRCKSNSCNLHLLDLNHTHTHSHTYTYTYNVCTSHITSISSHHITFIISHPYHHITFIASHHLPSSLTCSHVTFTFITFIFVFFTLFDENELLYINKMLTVIICRFYH